MKRTSPFLVGCITLQILLYDFPGQGQVPTAVTLGASQSGLTSVSVNGAANPNGLKTLVYCQYGLTTNYGNISAAVTLPATATALSFNGVNQNGTVAGFGNYAPTNEITIEFWENAAALGLNAPCFLNPEYSTNRIGVSLPWADGGTYWDFGDITRGGRLAYYPAGPLTGTWQHYALVASQSGNFMRIYTNGILEAESTGMQPFAHYAADLLLAGGTIYNYYFNGSLCEFRIWNTALDQQTIQTWMNSSLNPSHPYYSHLAGYWPMNDGSGSVAADLSGNFNNAVLTNSPVWTAGPALTNYQVNLSLNNISGGNVVYHYRIVAGNDAGDGFGADMTFQTGPFALLPTSFPGVFAGSVAWADLDNDGKLDVLLMGEESSGSTVAQAWRNLGGGSFSNLNLNLTPVANGGLAVGDFNNDDLLDFILTGSPNADEFANNTQVALNLGNGLFTNTANLPALAFSSVAVGDFDNDGRQDVVVMGLYDEVAPITQVWRNTGNGTFSQLANLPPGEQFGAIAVADFDKDGYEDILITGALEDGTPLTQLWRNLGNGTFTNVPSGLPNVGYGSVTVADFDQDGFPDILLSGYDTNNNAISGIWRNLGNGQFTNWNVALPGAGYGATAAGDFNNGGRPDFLLAGSTGKGTLAQLVQNQGAGSFTNFNQTFPGVEFASAAWGESENDGRLDLLLCGEENLESGATATLLVKNYFAVTNTPPSAPSGLTAVPTLTNTILCWNPATDAQTPSTGLGYNVRVGTHPGGFDVVSPEADPATGRRRVPARGNAEERLFSYYNLPPGTYYWSVQSIDTAYAGSPFAAEAQFTVGAPLIRTGSASMITSNSAALNGTLIANAANAGAWFEWGATTNYGNVTTTESLGAGTNLLQISLLAAPLQPSTTYYYRLMATNAYGTAYGASQSFTTLVGVPVAAPRFTGIARQPGGGVLLTIQGQSNISYTVLASTNLTQWTAFTNITAAPNGVLQLLQSTTNFPRRFFRLRYP